MNKKYLINVSYEDKSRMFKCVPSEFLQNVSKFYGIDASKMLLYSVKKGKKKQISFAQLKDLMEIEIILESTTSNPKEIDVISAYGSSRNLTQLRKKLQNNNILSELERKYLISLINKETSENTIKRKHDTELGALQGPSAYKRSKSFGSPFSNYKNSYVQTDEYFLYSNNLRKHNFSQTDSSTSMPKTIIEDMKIICEQESPNTEELERLMDLSFEERRQYIIHKQPAVEIVRKKYPALFTTHEVKKELDRIFYSGKFDRALKNIEKYSAYILDTCGLTSDIYQNTLYTMKNCFDKEQEHYAFVVGSVLAIGTLVKEPLSFIKATDHEIKVDSYPYIEVDIVLQEIYFEDAWFVIKVEGHVLCKLQNFFEAILCLIASFFIFNIGYTSTCRNTLVMFEKLFLEADETLELDNHTEQMIKLLKIKSKQLTF